MKNIIIDLEMNRIAKQYHQERRVCGMEIIEIGAVVLDESYQEIGSFKTLVKPQYNDVIERKYQKLTGITTEMVKDAPSFEQAMRILFSWCESLQDQCQIFQWSGSDHCQITKEIQLKNPSFSESEKQFVMGWQDFQEEYGQKLGLCGPLSLKNAIMYAGVEAEGHYHDALYDARNTAALFRALREDPGMRLFARTKTLEDHIKSGREEAPQEIVDLLDTGHEIDCVATFLCPTCQEWQTKNDPYILEKIRVSPYGTIREYKVHFINEKPKCEKCGTVLTFILNPRSSKNKCPKCGTENMKVGSIGFYD